MFKLDSLHVVLMVALVGVTINLGIVLHNSITVAQYKKNPNAMAEACKANPNLLVCQLPTSNKKDSQ
ncbi:hypothetical protein phiPsa267_175 [Pseudomonas phage phiPsa267]|uniref:Uncharacterized protein n=3 Tax=Otagovirus TaxID=2560197 RepID=A0A7G9V146_9CAUD|nr:hypothetical protein CF96_gp051 [Pseudomonas phage phiPsa374]YP_010767785.1 hypothetical protein QGX19_gp055 [Pseudomonas phage phiPsa267]YP_010767956.1 hypothetical protein QGX20_gp052 [Pseudomonas phage phiPsa300]AHJ87430.1 hypothetical protein phiPsa374_169 [Pseudomonas phage phiPsa374]QNO00002.1 hypothetical protein phiPsa267_175 [Pseudomonas phage phiPsa267]QNO00176.1 hypothetical protein phiPsa300_170 [Pseudomonas phage phiPsa300]